MGPSQETKSAKQLQAGFAQTLHYDEKALLAYVRSGGNAMEGLSEFFSRHVLGTFGDLSKSPLVDHSLWRLLSEPKIREAAITLTPFLDPAGCCVEQAEMVAVLGRFVQADEAVKSFLTDVSNGSADGLIALNSPAVAKADEKLKRKDEPRRPPTQEDDLKMCGLKLRE